jgi:octaprenyl-diphosphate synthase
MDNLALILNALQETGALSYSQKQAEIEAEKAINALSILPDSAYKQALITLAHIAADRST